MRWAYSSTSCFKPGGTRRFNDFRRSPLATTKMLPLWRSSVGSNDEPLGAGGAVVDDRMAQTVHLECMACQYGASGMARNDNIRPPARAPAHPCTDAPRPRGPPRGRGRLYEHSWGRHGHRSRQAAPARHLPHRASRHRYTTTSPEPSSPGIADMIRLYAAHAASCDGASTLPRTIRTRPSAKLAATFRPCDPAGLNDC
jgi:hypothetical protein